VEGAGTLASGSLNVDELVVGLGVIETLLPLLTPPTTLIAAACIELFPVALNADEELESTPIPQPMRFKDELPTREKAPLADGSSASIQFAIGSLTNAAVAVVATANEEGPSSRINVVFTDLRTVTVIAGTLAEARVTPDTAVGKLTETVSPAVPPNPFARE
jgi:hypothetical protein